MSDFNSALAKRCPQCGEGLGETWSHPFLCVGCRAERIGLLLGLERKQGDERASMFKQPEPAYKDEFEQPCLDESGYMPIRSRRPR